MCCDDYPLCLAPINCLKSTELHYYLNAKRKKYLKTRKKKPKNENIYTLLHKIKLHTIIQHLSIYLHQLLFTKIYLHNQLLISNSNLFIYTYYLHRQINEILIHLSLIHI